MHALMPAALAASITGFTAQPPNGFRVVAETRNFAFYSRDGASFDAKRSQRFLEETAKRLGARVDDRRAYYRYAWPEEVSWVVGTSATGAYLANGDIHSSRASDTHEIVHRVAFALGDPGPLFQEGLAVALGDGGRFAGVRVDALARRLAGRVGLHALAERFLSFEPEVRYPLAGSFVGYLIRKHGLARVAAYFRACGPDERARGARFAEVLGRSLDEEAETWREAIGG